MSCIASGLAAVRPVTRGLPGHDIAAPRPRRVTRGLPGHDIAAPRPRRVTRGLPGHDIAAPRPRRVTRGLPGHDIAAPRPRRVRTPRIVASWTTNPVGSAGFAAQAAGSWSSVNADSLPVPRPRAHVARVMPCLTHRASDAARQPPPRVAAVSERGTWLGASSWSDAPGASRSRSRATSGPQIVAGAHAGPDATPQAPTRRRGPCGTSRGSYAMAAAASASARVGWPSVPPAARVESEPHATANRRASASGAPVEPRCKEPGVERVARHRWCQGARPEAPARARRPRPRRRARRPRSRSTATTPVPPLPMTPSAPSAPSLTATVRQPAAPLRGARRAPGRQPRRPSSPASRQASRSVGQEQVGLGGRRREPTVPGARRVPVGIEAGGGARRVGRPEQRRDVRRETRLEEVAAERGGAGSRASSAAGTSAARTSAMVPGGGEDRPVGAVAEDDGCPGGPAWRHAACRGVDPARRHRLEHEPAERVIADDADHRHAQPEPRGAHGGDDRRAARHQPDRLDESLRLPEDGHRVGVRHDDVRVDLADDEQIEVARGAGGVWASPSS